MAADEKTRYLKEQLANYLMRQHPEISLDNPFKCLNPEHQDANPSMSYFAKKNFVKCFSCNATYDLFDLIGIDYGIGSFADQKAKAEAFFPTGYISTAKAATNLVQKVLQKNKIQREEPEAGAKPNFTKLYEAWHKCLMKTSYFKDRGLSQGIIERFKLGYAPTEQAVIIPCTKSYYVKRSTKPGNIKYLNTKNIRIQLFNADSLNGSEPVFITEGAIDALSIIETGFQALALNSSTNTNLLITEIESRERIPKLILFLDNDPAGKAAEEKLINYFTEHGITYAKTTAPAPYKDANDFLLADPQGLRKALITISKEAEMKPAETPKTPPQEDFTKTSIVNHLNNFISQKEVTTVMPTGFDNLDQILDGGLHEGLIILGAQSSLGKTTLAMQIALQAAKTGTEVLFYSLEQSTRELIAKLISCESEKELTISEVRRIASDRETSGEKIKTYATSADKLYKVKNLHIIEDKRSTDEIGKDLIARGASASKPLVIIDYLQMLKPGNGYQTDKQATDQNVSELKRISKTHKIPILAISSLNRQNYCKDISEEAFKESGAIEYSSDLLLGLQFTAVQNMIGTEEDKKNYEAEKAKNPRKVQLKIIKNRNGIASMRINFDYYAAHNIFENVKSLLDS